MSLWVDQVSVVSPSDFNIHINGIFSTVLEHWTPYIIIRGCRNVLSLWYVVRELEFLCLMFIFVGCLWRLSTYVVLWTFRGGQKNAHKLHFETTIWAWSRKGTEFRKFMMQ